MVQTRSQSKKQEEEEVEACEDCGVELRIGSENNPSHHSIFNGVCDDCREEEEEEICPTCGDEWTEATRCDCPEKWLEEEEKKRDRVKKIIQIVKNKYTGEITKLTRPYSMGDYYRALGYIIK